MTDNILYIDLETTKDGKVKDIGALFQGNNFHKNDIGQLESWIEKAKIICGHNVFAHDIPILEKKLGKDLFKGKTIIDTLLWSPLLFNDNPYHKLVKGYKIVNESEYNNPLSDCILTKELLHDELNKLNETDKSIIQIYAGLLGNNPHYSGLLKLIKTVYSGNYIAKDVSNKLEEKVCKHAKLESIINDFPIEFAYAFALINTKEDKSILSSWVTNTFPKTESIIDEIRFTSCDDKSCGYCTSNLSPQKALQQYFGYDNFRKFDSSNEISLQEKTVRAGLSKNSFVAVFPTGGGKSLTFQLPALMKGNLTRQLTVVISPLVSLMKDQVENLEKRFDINKAVALNGLLSPLERQEALQRVQNGEIQLLYLSPESLRSPTILRILKSRSIARFVIDEAHCFSSWGQDFRVDYLYIAEFIHELEEHNKEGKIPVSCFTATAKPQVIDDIKAYFSSRLDVKLDEYVTRASRKNLRYEVIQVDNADRKMAALLPLLEKCEKPAIIYASRVKRVEEIHGLIEKAGFNSTYFHGQLDKEIKKKNMNEFMSDEKDIIVATSAFGMGVDKEDVKSVIHYNISDSLENYIQESGRAGRNEDIQAQCYIIYNESDLNNHFSLLQQSKINHKEIQQIWQSLKYLSKYRANNNISSSALEIAEKAGWDTEIRELETRVKTAIAALEDQGFLKRKQNSPSVFATSLMVPSLKKALQIIHKDAHLTQRQIDTCSIVLQRIIKDDECRVDYVANRSGLKLQEVRDAINNLRSLKILGDSRDLTAFINLTNSLNSSKRILEKNLEIEKNLIKLLKRNCKFSFRQLNQDIIDKGLKNSDIPSIRNILNYWEIRNFIKKARVDRENEIYKLEFKDHKGLEEDIEWRHDLAVDTFRIIKGNCSKNLKEYKKDKKELPVSFSLIEIKEANTLFGNIKEENIKKYERVLLFLNQIKAIKLEGGFMVSYNRLNIEGIDKSIKRFTSEDYVNMSQHYLHKTEQIHIVGEYAKRQLENYESAISFVNDYFSIPYEDFLAKYFPRRQKEIGTPITKTRLKKIIGELDVDQTKIVTDGKSENMLVLAGPGSGKTKVLVHKIANLLLLEDIKPEQFLMLTFSKSASLEFKTRVRKLVPEYSGLIKITTFHSFCFQLLGQLGDLEKSVDVIKDCIQAIKEEEIDISMIANKSVLLLDEFQDVNELEWELIQTIIQKAGNIRVVAVGDDDQNIYGFRGASNKFMHAFKENNNATINALVRNYRSYSSIVDFNNELLNFIPNRLKENKLIAKKINNEHKVELINYSSNNFEKALVERLIQDNYKGLNAILTRTNEQALLLSTILRDMGQKVKLLTGLFGFTVNQLSEIRYFTRLIAKNKNEAGLIFNKEWKIAVQKFREFYKNSIHLETCLELIKTFENTFPKQKELMEWKDYTREIKMEDAIHGESETIFVSTMHKSKGKEFDQVYLMLDEFDFKTDDALRLLYVACSRARERLQIHHNSSFFNKIPSSLYELNEFKGITEKPNNFEVILSHGDINLNAIKYSTTQANLNKLQAGDALKYSEVQFEQGTAIGLGNTDGENLLLFSQAFQNKSYATFLKNGYQLEGGNVEYVVYWFDKKTEKEYLLILPRLKFSKP